MFVVREYKQGHIKGSINAPLNDLSRHIPKLKDAIITCCASGMRSASAKSILKSSGFAQVHNGGGWVAYKKKI
jgi:rhodanese-related sulfurtransferase